MDSSGSGNTQGSSFLEERAKKRPAKDAREHPKQSPLDRQGSMTSQASEEDGSVGRRKRARREEGVVVKGEVSDVVADGSDRAGAREGADALWSKNWLEATSHIGNGGAPEAATSAPSGPSRTARAEAASRPPAVSGTGPFASRELGNSATALGSWTVGGERSKILRTTLLNMSKRHRSRPEIHFFLGLLFLRENELAKAAGAFKSVVDSLSAPPGHGISKTREALLYAAQAHLAECSLFLAAQKEAESPSALAGPAQGDSTAQKDADSPSALAGPAQADLAARREAESPSAFPGPGEAGGAGQKQAESPSAEISEAAAEAEQGGGGTGEKADAQGHAGGTREGRPPEAEDGAEGERAGTAVAEQEADRGGVRVEEQDGSPGAKGFDMNLEAPAEAGESEGGVEEAREVLRQAEPGATEAEDEVEEYVEDEEEEAEESIAELQRETGGFAESAAMLLQTLRLEAQKGRIPCRLISNLGTMFALGRKHKVAAAFLASFLEAAEDVDLSVGGEVLACLGSSLLHLGDTSQAALALQSALQGDPCHPAALACFSALLQSQPQCLNTAGHGASSFLGSMPHLSSLQSHLSSHQCLVSALASTPGAAPLWAALGKVHGSTAALTEGPRGVRALESAEGEVDPMRCLLQALDLDHRNTYVRFLVAAHRIRSVVCLSKVATQQQLLWARNELAALLPQRELQPHRAHGAAVPTSASASEAHGCGVPPGAVWQMLAKSLDAEAEAAIAQLSEFEGQQEQATGTPRALGSQEQESASPLQSQNPRGDVSAEERERQSAALEGRVRQLLQQRDQVLLDKVPVEDRTCTLAFHCLRSAEFETARDHALEFFTSQTGQGNLDAASVATASNLGVALALSEFSHEPPLEPSALESSTGAALGASASALAHALWLCGESRRPQHAVLTNLSIVHRRAGNVPEAKAAARAALQVFPRYAPALNALGLAYAEDGKRRRAAAAFRQAMAADPQLEAARRNLKLIRRVKQRAQGAGETLAVAANR